MQVQKFTVSISQHLFEFLEAYQEEHQASSRSEVISAALQLLQQKQLEACYREANQELEDDFDASTGDGLEDEAW